MYVDIAKEQNLHGVPPTGQTGTAVTLRHWHLSTIIIIIIVNHNYYILCIL